MENLQITRLNARQLNDYIQIMHEQGKSQQEIKAELLAQGLSEERYLEALTLPPPPKVDRSLDGSAKVKKGAIWFFIGAAITMVTFSMAKGGGTYLVAFGPMVYGAVMIVWGIIDSADSDEQPED